MAYIEWILYRLIDGYIMGKISSIFFVICLTLILGYSIISYATEKNTIKNLHIGKQKNLLKSVDNGFTL